MSFLGDALDVVSFGTLGGLVDRFGGGDISVPAGPNPEKSVKGFKGPGLSGAYVPGSKGESGYFNLTRSSGMQTALGDILSRTNKLGADYGSLLPRVAPGVSELRASRLQGIENRRRAAIGNLRDNLSRRRLAGSSFASDALTRADITYEQEADRIRAESSIQELALTQDLLQKQASAELQGLNTMLSQFNIDSALGAQLATSSTAAINQALQLQQNAAITNAQLEAQSQAGIGQLIGTLGGAALLGGM